MRAELGAHGAYCKSCVDHVYGGSVTTTVYIDQSFRSVGFKDRRVMLWGKFWEPHSRLAEMITRHGGRVIEVPEDGKRKVTTMDGKKGFIADPEYVSVDGVFLAISPNSLVQKDNLGLVYELADSPVAHRLEGWINAGALPIAERDLQDALRPSSMSRLRTQEIGKVAARVRETCRDAMSLLDEVINDQEGR